MTEPERSTAEQPAIAPTVTTAPARDGWRSRIPAHLGRARTSTVVLAVLFLSIGAVYLNIRPETPSPPTSPASGTGVGTVQQVPATTPPTLETTVEPTPTTTTTAPRTTSAPTTTAQPTTSARPTETTTPEETVDTSVPMSSPPSPRATSPTVVSPPG